MSQQFQAGRDPREYVRNHRERGPKRYEYTYPDLAERLDVSLSTVQHYRPDTPEALARLVHRQQVRVYSMPLTPEAIEAVIGEGKLPLWEARWPGFQLWMCGGCQGAVLFSKGLCEACGGGKPAIAFDARGYIAVRVGPKYVPYHRLVLPTDLDVHHVDGNKWNNRPGNLTAVEHDAHMKGHRVGS
jgi:hypothetical protein